jgi:hypothetical protein
MAAGVVLFALLKLMALMLTILAETQERGKVASQLWRTPLASEGGESYLKVDARRQRMREAGDLRTRNLYKLTQEAQKADGVTDGTLNPEFVEWMMGYPVGWTEIKV